jgi:excinuclease UvrABC ATPase subunit
MHKVIDIDQSSIGRTGRSNATRHRFAKSGNLPT